MDNTLSPAQSAPSKSMVVKQASVIGAGQMGAGIAQVLLTSEIRTTLIDSAPEALERAKTYISSGLNKLVEKNKLSGAQRDKALSLLSTSHENKACAASDLIIEAIVEKIETKGKLFQELDSLCSPSTIFASNTSSISITKLAAFTKRPEKVVGMHFMNPVPLMQLVELIRGLQTNEETYATVLELTKRLGKVAVTARRDFPGFIVNRILMPMINEAVFVLMEGIATAEEIDTAMKLGTNQPMGPLELADFVGLDTCLAITEIFHRELGEDKYRPCPLMRKYVEAGWLGKKSGKGFYSYAR